MKTTTVCEDCGVKIGSDGLGPEKATVEEGVCLYCLNTEGGMRDGPDQEATKEGKTEVARA